MFGGGISSIGGNVSFQVQNEDGFHMSYGFGLNYGSSRMGTGLSGWESRNSVAAGYHSEKFSFAYSTSDFESGVTSQRTGAVSIGIGKKFVARYENDVPFGDMGDRYRTMAAYVGWGDVGVGVNLFTGDAGGFTRKERKDNSYLENNQSWYNEDHNYRAGMLYVSVNNYTFGRNSEAVRNLLQNEIAHRNKVPWFVRYDDQYPAYNNCMYRTFNPYTLY